jgi:hypothetical protein
MFNIHRRAALLVTAVDELFSTHKVRWRAVNAPHLVALGRAGARFEAGKLIERPDADPVGATTGVAA